MTAHFVNLLDELRRRSLRMASQVEDMLFEACEAISDPGQQMALRVIARDAEVDAAEVEVEAEVIRLLALYQPVGIDLRMLCTILKVNNDLERVADCAVNIAERAAHGELQAVVRDNEELRQLYPTVRKALRGAVQAYSSNDPEAARAIREQDQGIDALYQQIIRNVLKAADVSRDDLAAYLDLLSVAKNLERIADHATNIAEDVIFLSTGQIVRHRE
ncbi:MAG: phosphate signaling complex protein PhoU [Phycisphaerae bacterium]|jgi:phosphate transport system protein|nr:phosphate signaling complex protein PhoU [Phycisphaerae bacterium]HQL55423.1 phosphate signaling complex protein PhoU [Phycisphaerae bacterium]